MPNKSCTSGCVYRISTEDGKWSKSAFGKSECAVELRQSGSRLTGRVQRGLYDEIFALDALMGTHPRLLRYLFEHLGEIHTW